MEAGLTWLKTSFLMSRGCMRSNLQDVFFSCAIIDFIADAEITIALT